MNNMFYIGFGSGLFLGISLAIIFYLWRLKEVIDFGKKMVDMEINVMNFLNKTKEEKEDGTIREGTDSNP